MRSNSISCLIGLKQTPSVQVVFGELETNQPQIHTTNDPVNGHILVHFTKATSFDHFRTIIEGQTKFRTVVPHHSHFYPLS